MCGGADPEPNWQNNPHISTRKGTSNSILSSSYCRGHDPTSLKSPAPSHCHPDTMPLHHMGGPSMIPMRGPPSSGMMPVGAASGMMPPMGDHIPLMSWASDDETSCSPYAGAHLTWHDSDRQTKSRRALYQLCTSYSVSPGDHGAESQCF